MYWVRAGGSYSLVVALSMCPLASKRHIAVLLEAEGVWLENETTVQQHNLSSSQIILGYPPRRIL